jgi:DNA-binding transcriptional MerR regulator
MESITIGKLALLVDMNIETIRFYHREGLLKEPQKRANGYRYYGEDHALRLTFIKRAKSLGFTLKEIRELFEMNQKSKANCETVKNKASIKINEIEEKINNLLRIKKSLEELSVACELGSIEMKQFRVMDCFESNCKC